MLEFKTVAFVRENRENFEESMAQYFFFFVLKKLGKLAESDKWLWATDVWFLAVHVYLLFYEYFTGRVFTLF